MMRISGGLVLTEHGFQKVDIMIENGIIAALMPSDGTTGEVDATGHMVLPGFIDLHTHGGFGHDVNDANEKELKEIGVFFASQGVTSWLCSIMTDTREQTLRCIKEARKVINHSYSGATLMGIHLEGPCLSSEFRGCMPENLLIREASIQLFHQYQNAADGNIQYVTLSPEIPGAAALTKALTNMGIRVAIGHSGATYQSAMDCIQAGAISGTHVGNAMRLFHQHEPAIFGAIMESDVYCETICDGRHLHFGAVRLYLKTKGKDRIIGITDSIMATGLPDGRYNLGVNDIYVVDGDAKLKNGVRAGSTLTMAGAFRNFVREAHLSLEDAVKVTSTNAADLMGWNKGRIEPGKDADLIVISPSLEICNTVVGGKIVYLA